MPDPHCHHKMPCDSPQDPYCHTVCRWIGRWSILSSQNAMWQPTRSILSYADESEEIHWTDDPLNQWQDPCCHDADKQQSENHNHTVDCRLSNWELTMFAADNDNDTMIQHHTVTKCQTYNTTTQWSTGSQSILGSQLDADAEDPMWQSWWDPWQPMRSILSDPCCHQMPNQYK